MLSRLRSARRRSAVEIVTSPNGEPPLRRVEDALDDERAARRRSAISTVSGEPTASVVVVGVALVTNAPSSPSVREDAAASRSIQSMSITCVIVRVDAGDDDVSCRRPRLARAHARTTASTPGACRCRLGGLDRDRREVVLRR